VRTIQKYSPSWQVTLYGSFNQNLSTVFSDIDMAIHNKKNLAIEIALNYSK
jgi:DNA polymerase sigma